MGKITEKDREAVDQQARRKNKRWYEEKKEEQPVSG
jgi:hypothetical protein